MYHKLTYIMIIYDELPRVLVSFFFFRCLVKGIGQESHCVQNFWSEFKTVSQEKYIFKELISVSKHWAGIALSRVLCAYVSVCLCVCVGSTTDNDDNTSAMIYIFLVLRTREWIHIYSTHVPQWTLVKQPNGNFKINCLAFENQRQTVSPQHLKNPKLQRCGFLTLMVLSKSRITK